MDTAAALSEFSAAFGSVRDGLVAEKLSYVKG